MNKNNFFLLFDFEVKYDLDILLTGFQRFTKKRIERRKKKKNHATIAIPSSLSSKGAREIIEAENCSVSLSHTLKGEMSPRIAANPAY